MSLALAIFCACAADEPKLAPPPHGDRFASGIDAGSDLDGDCARDVLVLDEGTVYMQARVWLLSGRSGTTLRVLDVPDGAKIRSAAFAGDIDGDKKADVVVTTGQHGEARSWIAFSARTGRTLWTRTRGPEQTALAPQAWVGDIDRDGCRDQVCIETDPSWPADGITVLCVVSGRTGESIARFSIESADRHAISDAGDVDRDGHAEIAVRFQQKGRPVVGAYSVHASKWLWTASGGAREKQFGFGVTGGRDTDGDGITDVAVASPSEGFFVADRQIWRDPDQIHVLSGRDGARIDTPWLPADSEFGSFGESMSFVDDADGDGKPEIVLGDGDGWPYGRALWILSRGGPPQPVPLVDELWHFGRHACNAGDLDGDGAGDFLVTGTPYCHGQPGEVVAYSGRTLKCLWKRTREDVEPTSRPIQPPK
jgi:hypothetical protein